jgi:hypothetical protein
MNIDDSFVIGEKTTVQKTVEEIGKYFEIDLHQEIN